MKSPFRTIAFSFVFAFALAQNAPANLVKDSTFTTVSYNGTEPAGLTTLYGQFGTDGGNLTVGNWSTGGYNFVFVPGTTDDGTQAYGANGPNTVPVNAVQQPFEAPGSGTVTVGGVKYGNTYLWGSNNLGASTITAPPGGGKIIAADAIYQVGAITQTITGLTMGQVYVLKFYWAGAQQQGVNYTSATTEAWTASLGSQSFTTATVDNNSESFTGWMQQTFTYTATSTSEVLSFTASGGPSCEPPFALLADVDLEIIPDISNWMIFTGFGAVCIIFQVIRRRRRHSEFALAA